MTASADVSSAQAGRFGLYTPLGVQPVLHQTLLDKQEVVNKNSTENLQTEKAPDTISFTNDPFLC